MGDRLDVFCASLASVAFNPRGLELRLDRTNCTESPKRFVVSRPTCGPCLGICKTNRTDIKLALPGTLQCHPNRLYDNKDLVKHFLENPTNRSSTVKEAHHHQLQQQIASDKNDDDNDVDEDHDQALRPPPHEHE